MISKAFDRKQTTQNFFSKHLKKKSTKKKRKDNLTVFEPKHLLKRCYDETDAIPLGQTTTIKVEFKGQSFMFGLGIFSTQK